MSGPFVGLDTNDSLSEISFVCRGCLTESGEMKNMYEWGLLEDFQKFTEIQVQKTDSLPELLCTICEATLLTCREFRAQCQQSDVKLVKMIKKKTAPDLEESLSNTLTSILHEKKLTIMITAPLTEEKIYLTCPYHCTEGFTKKKDLYYHLNKTHNVAKDFEIQLQYYCSEIECMYHITSDSNKWFSERKFLNQHFNKVHRQKIFKCQSCEATFSIASDLSRHEKICKKTFKCQACNAQYNANEKLLVHLMRRHPDLHKQYKNDRKAEKRRRKTVTEAKKRKTDIEKLDFMCDSPKRSLATQIPEVAIKNDVSLVSWPVNKDFEARTDEISTQTVFEDLLSLKSQNSEDEIFFSETVSLSDIQTQTFPLEFGLSRLNKETQSYKSSETQSPDLSIKETQTCICHYESPRPNFRLFDSLSSSPASINLTSTETQTADHRCSVKSDVLLSFNSAETQTCFDDSSNDSM